MIKTYINYPEPHFTTHGNPDCRKIQIHGKEHQRYCQINSVRSQVNWKNINKRNIDLEVFRILICGWK